MAFPPLEATLFLASKCAPSMPPKTPGVNDETSPRCLHVCAIAGEIVRTPAPAEVSRGMSEAHPTCNVAITMNI